MSMTKWTDEQWDAITARDCNLLVAAAAGAGKTAVLVERIIKKITDAKKPIDIDRLLIVTFTNAAATEMRERIGQAISDVLEKNPGSGMIQRQLALLGKASIMTIHAFCTEVIRSNFQCLDIDPDFRIADETESSLMKLEALNELFDEQYEKENNTGFFELLECYGGNRDDRLLMDMVLNLYDFIQSSPWPETWLEEMTGAFELPEGTDFGQTVWGKVLLTSVKLELEGLRDMMSRAARELETAAGLERYAATFQEDIVHIESLLKLAGAGDWDRLFAFLQSLEFSALPRCGKNADKKKQEFVKKTRDDVKARLKKLRDKIVTPDSSGIIKDFKRLFPEMKVLSGLVSDLSERYREKKNRKSVLDFNDLEHFCLQILTRRDDDGTVKPSDVALSYRKRFEEIMVDEYQDSNMVQEIIIRMISKADTGKPNVFMVGDVKQSIYRFRQARPELFLHKYDTYSQEKGAPYRKILLFKNFRSRKNVVDTVNFVFGQIMSANIGELDYTGREALHPGAVFEQPDREDMAVGGATELHLIATGDRAEDSAGSPEGHSAGASARDRAGDPDDYAGAEGPNEDADDGDEEEIIDKIQCEARVVARRILELTRPDEDKKTFSVYVKNKETNQYEYRKIEFRDIVILLRTTKNWAEVFTDELAMYGIPAFADTGTGFFKTVEVQVVLSLLQIIDNPLQDIPLLSVLRSPIVSFSADDLAELRLKERKGPLFNALKKLASDGDGNVSHKAAAFLDNLQRWRELSLYLSTDRLIWRLYDDTGYYGMVGAMPAGEQRQANLRILFERARQFEETSYKGLFNFINFIDKLRSSRGDMGSAKILSENDNVVRIMSIHKSKGLEFPVVFLSGCGKKFNLQDMNKSILLHQDLGFGPDVVDYKLRLSWPSAAKQAIREKIKTETLSEEMRILYVALTRAREKLIITGAVNDLGRAAAKWLAAADTTEDKLYDYEMLRGGSYLDWIGPALIRHGTCSGLRELLPPGSEYRGALIDDPSQWRVKLWKKSDVRGSNIFGTDGGEALASWLKGREIAPEGKPHDEDHAEGYEKKPEKDYENGRDDEKYDNEDIRKEIDRRLSWEYPYSKASDIPAKVTVTELKRRFDALEAEDDTAAQYDRTPVIKKPVFLEEKKGLSAAEKGTILHFIMQHLDLEGIKSCFTERLPEKRSEKAQRLPERAENLFDEISGQVDAMIARDLLTRQQADSADFEKISRFFVSELGERMLASQEINREVPFNIEIPCGEIYRGADGKLSKDDTVLLQGVIDCFFEEDGGIVLIDYKTDYVVPGGEESVKERYRLQISYYSRALELLAGKKVREKYIYLFRNGEILRL